MIALIVGASHTCADASGWMLDGDRNVVTKEYRRESLARKREEEACLARGGARVVSAGVVCRVSDGL